MSEAIQYEVPAHLLEVTYEGKRLGEGKNLGEAVIVKTLFGRTRVRIVHEDDKPNWLWPVVIVVMLGIAAAVWWWLSASQPSGTGSKAMTPATPAAPPADQTPRNIPELSNPVESPATQEQPAQSRAHSPEQPSKQETMATEKAVVTPQPVKKPEARKVPVKKAPPAAQQSSAAKPAAATRAAQPAVQPVAVQPSATPTALQPTIKITKHPVASPADPNSTGGTVAAPPADSTQQPAAQPQ